MFNNTNHSLRDIGEVPEYIVFRSRLKSRSSRVDFDIARFDFSGEHVIEPLYAGDDFDQAVRVYALSRVYPEQAIIMFNVVSGRAHYAKRGTGDGEVE
jgi:hypothetical protein